MNNKSDREELLADVLADETQLRATTLEFALHEMRCVRRRRRAARFGVMVCTPILVLAAALLVRNFQVGNSTAAAPQVVEREETIPGTSIQVLSDEQLLALFKGRPVALVGPAGHQRLLLLDEAAN